MMRFIAVLAATAVSTSIAAQQTPLRSGESHRGTAAPGDTIRYGVDAPDDYFVRGVADQISADITVRIVRPDGRQLRSIGGLARGEVRFQFETDGAGIYVIEIISSQDETGEYAIALDRLEPLATDPRRLADQLLSAYDGEDSPGAAVAVFKDGRTLFAKAYGMANLAYGIPFEVDTRTNIGSTSKQFTAFAVMLLVERGKLSLDDDVRTFIPELPDFGDTVRVRNLLTHTTGFREFLNLMRMAGRRLDHGDYIDRRELVAIVQRQPALQNAPGAEYNYNNTAFGLAALIVERISGMPFHEFMARNVFGPIGMTRTMVRPSPEHIVPESSEGYTPTEDGGYRVIGDFHGAVGAGGIYTTIGDLQRWVENYATARVGSRAIFEQMMTRNVLTTGDTTSYGLGLTIGTHRGLRRVSHGGADTAHRSQLMYYPEINAGITTQSNYAAFDGSIATRLAEAFFAEYMEPERDASAGGPPDRDATNPWSPTVNELTGFVGRYFSPEIETFYSVRLDHDRLVLEHRRMDDSTLRPGATDTFAGGGLQLSFERDRNYQVIGFYMSNGRTRGVRFERVN